MNGYANQEVCGTAMRMPTFPGCRQDFGEPLPVSGAANGYDTFLIGLTATPSKQTFGFFNQNLVMEHTHEEAVADAVNVDYQVYRIKTEITEKGSGIDAGIVTTFRNRESRALRWEKVDERSSIKQRSLTVAWCRRIR